MGQSVGKIIIIILSFWDGTSKNKNIDHRVKETSVFELKRHLFTCDSKMSSALIFFFLYFIVIYKNKGHSRRYIKSVLLLF